MISNVVTYEDWDGNSVTETLWFHISKTDLAGNLHLIEKLEGVQKVLSGPKRELQLFEIEAMLDLVKTFAQMSFGRRSEDGKRFKKTPEVWEEFTETGAYDAFMMSLFKEPTKAMDFLVGVIPNDLREQAMQDLTEEQRAEVQPHVPQPMPTQPMPTQTGPAPTTDLSMEELMAEMRRRQEAEGQTSGG